MSQKIDNVLKEEKWEDKYDILRELTNVHSTKVKDVISKDFTLAHLNEKDRVMITDTYRMAQFVLNACNSGLEKKIPFYVKGTWIYIKIRDIEKRIDDIPEYYIENKGVHTWAKRIIESGIASYNTLMSLPFMIVILKRNMKDNWLAELVGGRVREGDQAELIQDIQSEKKGIKEKLVENAQKNVEE